MDDQDIKDEINKAVDLFLDTTWTADNLKARMFQLINETGLRDALQRYINQVLQMRQSQIRFFEKKDKSIVGKAKMQEAVVDKKSRELLRKLGITNVEEFLKMYQQQEIF